MNRRHFITTGGIATATTLAGCTALVGSSAEPTIDRMDQPEDRRLIADVAVEECSFDWGDVCFLEVDLTTDLTASFELWVIPGDHRRDVFYIREGTEHVTLQAPDEHDWDYPIRIEARGADDRLLDRVDVHGGS